MTMTCTTAQRAMWLLNERGWNFGMQARTGGDSLSLDSAASAPWYVLIDNLGASCHPAAKQVPDRLALAVVLDSAKFTASAYLFDWKPSFSKADKLLDAKKPPKPLHEAWIVAFKGGHVAAANAIERELLEMLQAEAIAGVGRL